MKTYEPGDAVWAFDESTCEWDEYVVDLCDTLSGAIECISIDDELDDDDLPPGYYRFNLNNVRPRDPSLEGADKPKE